MAWTLQPTRAWAQEPNGGHLGEGSEMLSVRWGAQALVASVRCLREPYRQNAVNWLETCVQQPIGESGEALVRFLDALNPSEREAFFSEVRKLLEDAVRYFGLDGPWYERPFRSDGRAV